jgi:hypothetical protein
MSGGKGGSTTSTVKIPAWLEDAARENLARANTVANIGPTPYYGPDVAAMTPMQIASNQGVASSANAFGLPGGELSMGIEGMPAPQTFAGGLQGYSSGGLYDQAVQELQTRRPGQYDAITGMFINPQTGAAPTLSFGPNVAAMPQTMPTTPLSYSGGGDGNGGGGGGGGYYPGTGGGGADSGQAGNGYRGLRDMLNGGGPGASGSTFSGGGILSGVSNTLGINPVGSGNKKSGKK